jgi:hypothetical protein
MTLRIAAVLSLLVFAAPASAGIVTGSTGGRGLHLPGKLTGHP